MVYFRFKNTPTATIIKRRTGRLQSSKRFECLFNWLNEKILLKFYTNLILGHVRFVYSIVKSV